MDRMRESLFNIVQHELADAQCLDLFAGSGICGLEALSRRATRVDFVDHSASMVASIKKHSKLFGCYDRSFVTRADVLTWLKRRTHGDMPPYDLVFMDPPYDSELYMPTLHALAQHARVRPETRVCFDGPAQLVADIPAPWRVVRCLRSAHTALRLLRLAGSA